MRVCVCVGVCRCVCVTDRQTDRHTHIHTHTKEENCIVFINPSLPPPGMISVCQIHILIKEQRTIHYMDGHVNATLVHNASTYDVNYRGR